MSISSDFAVSMMIGTDERAPQAPADLQAVHPGHHHVEHDEVEGLLGEAVERLAAVGRLDDLVAVALQREREQRLDRLLVVHEQDAGCSISHDPLKARIVGGAPGTVTAVLDVRVYRAAFLPALIAVFVAAFSLADRPRPDDDGPVGRRVRLRVTRSAKRRGRSATRSTSWRGRSPTAAGAPDGSAPADRPRLVRARERGTRRTAFEVAARTTE